MTYMLVYLYICLYICMSRPVSACLSVSNMNDGTPLRQHDTSPDVTTGDIWFHTFSNSVNEIIHRIGVTVTLIKWPLVPGNSQWHLTRWRPTRCHPWLEIIDCLVRMDGDPWQWVPLQRPQFIPTEIDILLLLVKCCVNCIPCLPWLIQFLECSHSWIVALT